MILDKILGYWVTDAPDVLESFVAQVRERYTALEQALDPIAATVSDLEGDWKTRWASYWQAKIGDLASLRTATQATLNLFDRDQSSQTAPVPIVISATSLGYKFGLHTVQSKIEEAGILLTSYIEVCDSHKEQHLRQRQRVLKALQEVVKATREAINEGRDQVAEATREQQKITRPYPVRKGKLKTIPVSTTDAVETITEQPSLHVVREEGAE